MTTGDTCRFYLSKYEPLLQSRKDCLVSDAYCLHMCTYFEYLCQGKVQCKYQDLDEKLEEILK
jgi:hypothetical protein